MPITWLQVTQGVQFPFGNYGGSVDANEEPSYMEMADLD